MTTSLENAMLRRHALPQTLIAFVTLWIWNTGRAEAVMIQIKATATASSSLVRLGDIANILDADPETTKKLKQLALVPAPAPGNTLRLDFAAVRSRLQAHGLNMAQTAFSGRSVVTVTAGDNKGRGSQQGKTVASWKHDRVDRLVTDSIVQHIARLAPELGSVNVSISVEPQYVDLILGGIVSGYDIRGGKPPWLGKQMLTVRFLDRNEKLYEVPVQARISRRPDVLVVRYTVPRGQVLQKSDLQWRQMKTAKASFTSFEDVIGKETTRTIREGESLSAADVRTIPLVRNNDIVTVYSRRPGVVVRRQLKSRGDGSKGDTITLVTLDGRERMLGRITGYHEAEVVGSESTTTTRQRARGRIQFRNGQRPQKIIQTGGQLNRFR